MENLVFKSTDSQAITNSLLIAEKFEKEHRNVNRSIRELLGSAQNCAHLFCESEYTDTQGKSQPMYVMNRDGFSLLVMGFTGTKALEFKLSFLEAFNKMEETLKGGEFKIPQTMAEALRLAADNAEQIEAQQKQLTEQAPKVLLAEAITASKNSILIRDLAKILKQNGIDIGQNRLFDWFKANGYICKSGRYNTPTQRAMDLGVFEVTYTPRVSAEMVIQVPTVKVTGKGQIYFVNKFIYNQSQEK